MKSVASKILEKKELKGISPEFVNRILSDYLRKNKISLSKLAPKEANIIVKDIRSTLRKYVGRFAVSNSRRIFLLNSKNVCELLKTHASTKERLRYYDYFKKTIYSLKPASILDLGCGLNPIAIADKNIKYYAFDINYEDLKIVKKFFEKNGIQGEIRIYDLMNPSELPYADLTLILKTLDILQGDSSLIERIFKKIKSPRIIASFSTITISGRPMKNSKRRWFENLLLRNRYIFQTEEIPGEIFYFISKTE